MTKSGSHSTPVSFIGLTVVVSGGGDGPMINIVCVSTAPPPPSFPYSTLAPPSRAAGTTKAHGLESSQNSLLSPQDTSGEDTPRCIPPLYFPPRETAGLHCAVIGGSMRSVPITVPAYERRKDLHLWSKRELIPSFSLSFCNINKSLVPTSTVLLRGGA